MRSETACEPCENGTLPHPDLTRCVPIPEDYLTYDDSIAVVVMTVAALGVVVTSFVIAVFVRHQATPVVRAAGRELTFVLLGGILGCYLMTFIIISPPSLVTCGVQRFGNGFWFSVCYSALLTKTNRIARIFRAGKRTIKRPNFISPMSQLVICAALVTLQVGLDSLVTLTILICIVHCKGRTDNVRSVMGNSTWLYHFIFDRCSSALPGCCGNRPRRLIIIQLGSTTSSYANRCWEQARW